MSHLPEINRTLEILIVDDDSIIRMLHRHTLERCNICHSVVALPNGKEALNYLQEQQHPTKDFLVLLDINMPVMNGWEFLEKCQSIPYAENIYTVMVSSSINQADKNRVKRFPQVLDFLEKPFSPQSVADLAGIQELAPFFKGFKKKRIRCTPR